MVQEIIKKIEYLSGNYSEYDIFSDWIKACAIGISNTTDIVHGEIWKMREEQYLEIVKKHGKEVMLAFGDMTGMLALELERQMYDVLGTVYMGLGIGNKNTGQFFTPPHISRLVSEVTIESQFSHFDENDQIELNEPSCGGGGMIIAAAETLKNKGINYQRRLSVIAQDLDWKGVYMCYVQLSILGIKAIVVQGDTLKEPYNTPYPKDRVFYTPAKKGMIL